MIFSTRVCCTLRLPFFFQPTQMGKVIRVCRKGKGSVFRSHTSKRIGAVKLRVTVASFPQTGQKSFESEQVLELAAGSCHIPLKPAGRGACGSRIADTVGKNQVISAAGGTPM